MIYQHLLGTYLFVINLGSIMTLRNIAWQKPPMYWVDVPSPLEIFFDRVVSISLDLGGDDHKMIATGVLVSNQLVLSAFNPFRELIKYKEKRELIVIGALKYRWFSNGVLYYNISYGLVACARQVIPMRDEDLIDDQWHGQDRLYSPVHDLIIFRLDRNFTLENNNTNLYVKVTNWPYEYGLSGPLLTDMAEPGLPLGRDLMMASIGHVDDAQIKKDAYLKSYDYEIEDNAETNCDEWIPRTWGHFICIRNVHEFEAIASGGVLYQNKKLFGIASFALRKGKKSILVFTDVRPYYTLINETCIEKDQI